MEQLTEKQKETLRNISILEYSNRENRKGRPLKPGNAEFKMLSTQQIFALICEKITQNGFSKVKRVSPNEANCLIRVFKKQHYAYDDCPNMMINLYGANCFVLKNGNWVCSDDKYLLDYSEHKVRYWLCIDDSNTISTDFFDVYTKVEA